MADLLRDAFAQFVQDKQAAFYRLAYSYVRSEDEALDVVQDAVERALRRLHTLREPAYMRTWFYRVLVNECLTHLRRAGRRGAPVPLEAATAQPAAQPEEPAALRALIEALPPELKTVVFLRFYEDMKLREIAEVTHEPLSTVKTRLYRALRLLRATITEEEA